MDSEKIVRPTAFGEISKGRGGTEDFRGSHGFQRQRRMEAEDFVGVTWFLGVMKGGGGFWGIALFSGVTERGAEDFEESHGFQRQRRVEAENFVRVMWFSGVMERGAEDFRGSHGFQG